jgi:hypothetical protein
VKKRFAAAGSALVARAFIGRAASAMSPEDVLKENKTKVTKGHN